MDFKIRMGIPEIEDFWNSLSDKAEKGILKQNERKVFKKLLKTINLLSSNPRHNSLSSHEIAPLSKRYGIKVWQSYLENKTPSAGRIFWTYGPVKNELTIIGIEPHPEDKKSKGYSKVKLSDLP